MKPATHLVVILILQKSQNCVHCKQRRPLRVHGWRWIIPLRCTLRRKRHRGPGLKFSRDFLPPVLLGMAGLPGAPAGTQNVSKQDQLCPGAQLRAAALALRTPKLSPSCGLLPSVSAFGAPPAGLQEKHPSSPASITPSETM